MERAEELKQQVRETLLSERLVEARSRIGKMCSEGRPPRMTIPVQYDDDDFYISTTLSDAQATIADLQGQLEVAQNKQTALEKSVRNLTEFYDKYNGTPCEQIRHQQEVELLQQRVAQLEGERADWKKAADDEPSAIYLGQLKAAKAALTPQAGKGGGDG